MNSVPGKVILRFDKDIPDLIRRTDRNKQSHDRLPLFRLVQTDIIVESNVFLINHTQYSPNQIHLCIFIKGHNAPDDINYFSILIAENLLKAFLIIMDFYYYPVPLNSLNRFLSAAPFHAPSLLFTHTPQFLT